MNAMRHNPGLISRNKFGLDAYKHLEHKMVLGNKHFRWGDSEIYSYQNSGEWNDCPEPGAHYCLEQMEGDGNLQFHDPVP